MSALFSRHQRAQLVTSALSDEAVMVDAVGDVTVPEPIAAWLRRLYTLIGVPFGYLVPDEAMLPPESIRFFRLDHAWAEALIDGAFSLGRDLTLDATTPAATLDRVLSPHVRRHARAGRPGLGALPAVVAAAGEDTAQPWTGFLLRSRVVGSFPGLGVNVYPAGHTPDDPQPVLLVQHRLDHLGPGTDTLLCLVEGEAHRVDVHEAPEALHYGVDSYVAPASTPGHPSVSKAIHGFVRAADGTITFPQNPDKTPVMHTLDLSASFRARSPRVVSLAAVAAQVGTANQVPTVDSAQLGFELTEGVGMVSFLRQDPA